MRHIAVSLLAAIAFSGQAFATEFKINEAIQTVAVSGDLALRHENITYANGGDYNQERFRARLALKAVFNGGIVAHMRFATASPSSTNGYGGNQASEWQTETNMSGQKSFWIDRASLEWKAPEFSGINTTLAGGKMANPFWTVYVSNIMWSEQFSPEGYAEKFSYKTGSLSLFGTAFQMVVNNNANNSNQWMLGEQAGAELPLSSITALRFACGYYYWKNVNKLSLNPASMQPGNTVTGTGNSAVLQSKFGVGELTAEYATKLHGFPLSVQGTYIKNLAAQLSPKYDTGYQAGLIFGKANKAKLWEAAYFYKMAEPDSTVANVVDTIFGPGGTNVKGHAMWVAYNPIDVLQIKAKYYITRPVIDSMSAYGDTNRFQIETSVMF